MVKSAAARTNTPISFDEQANDNDINKIQIAMRLILCLAPPPA